jgi:hypothetical protein
VAVQQAIQEREVHAAPMFTAIAALGQPGCRRCRSCDVAFCTPRDGACAEASKGRRIDQRSETLSRDSPQKPRGRLAVVVTREVGVSGHDDPSPLCLFDSRTYACNADYTSQDT